MKLDKRVLLPAVAGLMAISLVGCGFWASHSVNKNFHESLTSAVRTASGAKVILGETSINILTGSGSVDLIALNDTQVTDKNLFEVSEVKFSYAPTSLLVGPIRVHKISTGPIGIVGNIIGSGSRVKTMILAVKEQLSGNVSPTSGARIIVEDLDIGEGRMKIGAALLGSTIEREIPFPATTLAAIGENESGLSPVQLARKIIYGIGLNAMTATTYSIPPT